MSTHTPGPWRVDIIKDGGNWDYQIRTVKPHNPGGKHGVHIAATNAYLEAKGEANANLIAAAPELLELLTLALTGLDETWERSPQGLHFKTKANQLLKYIEGEP